LLSATYGSTMVVMVVTDDENVVHTDFKSIYANNNVIYSSKYLSAV
jgi:hypothetical protein